MLKNSSKMLFFFCLISGSLISISSNSWFGVWMGLEINLMSFIPLMIDYNNSMSTESALKYFLTQAFASACLLFSMIIFMNLNNLMYSLNLINNNYIFLVIISTLLLKMGAAPFHFWFPTVMEGLNWNNNLMLMTWQKIAPLMLISYLIYNNNSLFFFIILSIIIGSIGGLSQTSLKKIMAFSSINHLGWMLIAMITSENLWMIYFLIYSFLCLTLILNFNLFKMFHINQMFSNFNNFPIMKIFLMMSLLSLGGLPPFLGFLPKWLVIQNLNLYEMNFILMIMICLTLLTLFYYLQICYSAFMLNYWEINLNFNQNYSNLNMKMSYFFSFFAIFGLIFISLFTLL